MPHPVAGGAVSWLISRNNRGRSTAHARFCTQTIDTTGWMRAPGPSAPTASPAACPGSAPGCRRWGCWSAASLLSPPPPCCRGGSTQVRPQLSRIIWLCRHRRVTTCAVVTRSTQHLQTSILLYTYRHLMYLRLPCACTTVDVGRDGDGTQHETRLAALSAICLLTSMTSMRSSTVESSLNSKSQLCILYSCRRGKQHQRVGCQTAMGHAAVRAHLLMAQSACALCYRCACLKNAHDHLLVQIRQRLHAGDAHTARLLLAAPQCSV